MSRNKTPHIWHHSIDSKYAGVLSYFEDRHQEFDRKLISTLTEYSDVPAGSGQVSVLTGEKYHDGWKYRRSIGRGNFCLFYWPLPVSNTV